MKKPIGVLICLLMVFESISVFAQGEAIKEKAYTLSFGKPSQSGYSDYAWLDEEGEEVSFENRNEKSDFQKRTVLPSEYNSAESGLVTNVKDQGITGSCWAFSFMSAAESNLLKQSDDPAKDNALLDLSEAHHVWFTHNSLVDNTQDPTGGDGVSVSSPYHSGGNWLRSTFALARGMGFANESDYPYYPYSIGSMGNYDESSRYESVYRLKDSYTIPSGNVSAIKEAIMQNGSVTAAFYLSNTYLTQETGNYCYYCPNEYGTNHQITIVGWDDGYLAENFKKASVPSSNGAWIVKNSYGDSWGDDGYFRISYFDKSLDNFHTLHVEDSSEYENVYQYDGYGYSQGLSATLNGEAIKTASFANVFTADEDETVDKVSFYAVNSGAEYTIEVYTSLPGSYATPVYNGICALSQSGSVDYSGYYTIDLEERISVSRGERFSVVVTVSSNSGALVPLEGQSGLNDGSYDRYYSSSVGQSYYRFGTSSWQDSSAKGMNNVCVKAFASTPDTVEISSCEELVELSNVVNGGKSFKDKTVILLSDIDMEGIAFVPIGTQNSPFEGTFDGNGKVISDLNIIAQDNAGLFGVTGKNSLIKLTGLENVCVSGENNVGALIGLSNSKKVYNCYSTGIVSGRENVGGLIGFNLSATTDNCFSVASVEADTVGGAFAGYSDSSCVNCFVLDAVQPFGNTSSNEGVTSASSDDFANGYVAYRLESNAMVWTKGNEHPVFSGNPDDTVHVATVFVIGYNEFVLIYLTKNESLKTLLEEKYEGYSCSVYTDYSCNNEFTGDVTFNRTLFAKIEEAKLILVEGSSLEIRDGILYNVSQGMTALEIVEQFKNADVRIADLDGDELSAYDIVSTGFSVYILNRSDEVRDEVKVLVYGDLNSDGYVDAFDLAILCSAVNFETEIEQDSVFEKAGDLNPDGFLDAFDLSVMTAAVNFEIEL